MTQDDCIEDHGHPLDKDGYPRIKHQGRMTRVSRLIMFLLHGKGSIIGRLVCHTCNNPTCVNPNHLYIGDAQTNSDGSSEDER